MKKYLPLLLLLAGISTATAGDLKSDIQSVREAVKKNHTHYQVNFRNPSDTTYIFKKGDQTIKAGSDFTSFYSEGDDKNLFMFDIGSDGSLERAITVEGGRLDPKRGEKHFVEMEGLGGNQGILEVELSLNDINQRVHGKTPHNTRKVYCLDSDSTGTGYNFDTNESARLNPEHVRSLKSLYVSVVKSAKKILGLSK